MYLIGTSVDKVDIWDLHSKQHKATLKVAKCNNYPYTYSCSTDGRLLAICARSFEQVVVWDLSTIDDCKVVHTLSIPSFRPIIHTICFINNDEKLIVGFDNNITVFDIRSGSSLMTVEVEGRYTAFIHDIGDRIITVSDKGTLQEWNPELTEIRREQLGVSIRCASINSSQDVIAASVDNSIMVLDVATATKKKLLQGNYAIDYLQFNIDGDKLLASQLNSSRALVVDLVGGIVLFEFESNGGVCFSLDCSHIYGSSSDGYKFSVDSTTGSLISGPFPREVFRGRYDRLFILSPASVVLM
jgi:WD40 repeat protein